VKYEEPRYGFPAALRAHGNYSWTLEDPEGFFRTLVGGQSSCNISDLRTVLANRIVQTIGDYIAESRPPYLEVDARREEMATAIQEKLAPEFSKLGLRIQDFRIEGADFDDDTMKRVKQIGDRQASAQEAKVLGLDYGQMQQLDALRDAARNPGGAAGAGVSVGAGLALGNAMASGMPGLSSGATRPASIEERLRVLQDLFDKKLIGDAEYQRKRQSLLDAL
jgi:membrane protease subunit (stomatin/prohibitin family)